MFNAVLLILFVCLFTLPRSYYVQRQYVCCFIVPIATPIHIWICGAVQMPNKGNAKTALKGIEFPCHEKLAQQLKRVRIRNHRTAWDTMRTVLDYYCFSWECFIDEMLAINFESYTKVSASIWVCASRYYIHKRLGLRRICTP